MTAHLSATVNWVVHHDTINIRVIISLEGVRSLSDNTNGRISSRFPTHLQDGLFHIDADTLSIQPFPSITN